MTIIVLAVGLLTACSGANAPTSTPRPPTPIPPTPTPRSTALPALDQPPALLGGAERPLVIAFALSGANLTSQADRAALAQTVADALQPLSATLNLAADVEVQIAQMDDSAALRALCSGAPVTAWVSPFTYAAAARTCEVEPLLALVREDDGARVIGAAYDIVTAREIESAADLAGQIACRVADRLDAWAISALMLRAEGLDPLAQMSQSEPYADEAAALNALLDGDCAALTLPRDTLDDLLDPLPASDNPPRERLHILVPGGDTSAPDNGANRPASVARYVVPFGLWVAAPEFALPASESRPVRQELEAAVRAYFDAQPDAFDEWFGGADAVEINRAGLSALLRWLDNARWDMAYHP